MLRCDTKPLIPAIVLTCQRNIPVAEHMIDRYASHWPDHPFRFRLPDCSAARALAERSPVRLQLMPTEEGDGRGQFRAAVLGLLDGLGDDEWIYWCTDDRYVEWIDVPMARSLVDLVTTTEDSRIAGVCFARARGLTKLDPAREDTLKLGNYVLVRRPDYRQIWLHQLLRTKVLRGIFERFPPRVAEARDMGPLARSAPLPDDCRLYVTSRNAVVFGESTARGRLTANCARSMSRGRGVPAGFQVDSRCVTIGERPGMLTGMLERISNVRRWVASRSRRVSERVPGVR